MIKVFLAVYELMLISAAVYFCSQLQQIYTEYKVTKKMYCLAPRRIRPGHTVEPTRDEIKPLLKAKQIELTAWTVIIFCSLIACIIFPILN